MPTFKWIALFVVLAAGLVPLGFVVSPAAEANRYRVRAEDSAVGFTATKWGVFKVEGRFTQFEGLIQYDPATPAQTQVSFTVEVASVTTGNPRRDGAVRGRNFLHAAAFPTLKFQSTQVVQHAPDLLEVTGDLTLRGVTRPLTVPVQVLGLNTVEDLGRLAGFETRFTLDRMDFGIDGWPRGVGQEVEVHLLISANDAGVR